MRALTATLAAVGASLGVAVLPMHASARTCPHSYTRALMGGKQKCLRSGEECSHRYASQYLPHGFRMHARVSRLRSSAVRATGDLVSARARSRLVERAAVWQRLVRTAPKSSAERRRHWATTCPTPPEPVTPVRA